MPLATSKGGFTTLEVLIAIGILVLLVSVAGVYVGEWRPNQIHTQAIEIVRDTLLEAQRYADNGRNAENWKVVLQSTSITLEGVTTNEQETYALPTQSVLSWQGSSTITYTAPFGFPNATKTLTITTGHLTTTFTINAYGILEKQ